MKKIAILFLVLSMIFCASCVKNDDVAQFQGSISETTPEVVTPEEAVITLYYSDNQAMYLEKEERTVSGKDAADPGFVLGELFKGPENSELINVLPPDIKLNSCTTEDRVCIIDLSKEFNEIQGSAAQQMALYSVVNTLCSVEGVDKVRILIDGEVNPPNCVFDFSEDIMADMSIVNE